MNLPSFMGPPRGRYIALGALALLLAAFLAGRYSRPPEQVKAKDEVRTVVDTTASKQLAIALAEIDRLHKELATWQEKATTAEAHVSTVIKWKYRPGGGIAEVSEEKHADTQKTATSQGGTKETTDATAQKNATGTEKDATASQATTVELHTVERVPVLPQWSVSVMPGVDLRGNSSLPYHAVVGASIERRIIGPLFLGAWGNTAGAVGISIRGDL